MIIMKKATIGFIGCGHIARDQHLKHAFSNPRIRVKWCCDLENANLQYVQEHYAPERVTKAYQEVLEDPYPEICDGEGTNLYINKMRERNRVNTDATILARSEVNKGHYNMLDKFIDCILLDAPSPCDVLDGARATLMCLKARESARLGLPVKISIDEYDYVFA